MEQVVRKSVRGKQTKSAREIKVFGIVQGVGFRPHVYRISQQYELMGWVLNNTEGVRIHWEGTKAEIDAALKHLLEFPPPLAKITGYQDIAVSVQEYSSFFIQESFMEKGRKVLISPDVAMCTDCMREFKDVADRRQGYPFINCTNCGPRFTIIKDVPYDRKLTTMKEFTMCPECSKEYHDPLNRRFHAQPNACDLCGPVVQVVDNKGRFHMQYTKDISQLIIDGNIVAVKGLGGFHLVCNAFDVKAVERLRKGKERDGKPFALMASDLECVRKFCQLSSVEEAQLISLIRPIVLLKCRNDIKDLLPKAINPGLDSLGMMLPYAPIHWMLFSSGVDLLVATSANMSSNPLITDNDEAIDKLKNIADYFIINNREIENPCDDSVVVVINEVAQPIRRARGYVPAPIVLPGAEMTAVLACGGSLKNVFALAKGEQFFLSQHLGDMDNYLNFEIYKATVEKMISLLDIQPEIVVHDLHPDYHTTRYAQELAVQHQLPCIGVQHHHAHMVSCMVDNGIKHELMGVVCDGTGYGLDGAIWGFEFLYGDHKSFNRMGHLANVLLPGGEISIRRPSRMAFSFLTATLGDIGRDYAHAWLHTLAAEEMEFLKVQLDKKINSTFTSSCGRLFDAASALMDICTEQVYEGQAPMEMEAIAAKRMSYKGHYKIAISGTPEKFELDTMQLWEGIIADLTAGTQKAVMAYKFHLGVALAIKEGVMQMSSATNSKEVVLSGGVFANKLLVELVLKLLKNEQIKVYLHKNIPMNDGGIAVGQCFIGNEVAKKCV